MITCPQCNKELADDAKFCDGCGAKIQETIFCSNCGQQTSTEFAFCQNCGASLAVEEIPVEEEPVQAEPVQVVEEVAQKGNGFDLSKLLSKLPFKIDEKMAKLGAVAVAGLLVIILVISMISGAVNKDNVAFYVQDGELMFTKLSGIKPWEVTEDGVGGYPQLSKNGKKIFYIENDDRTLYYRSATNPKKEAEKIASNVLDFRINEKANRVTYKKNGNLYQSNLKDSEKIASDVSNWDVSKNGKNVVWLDNEGTGYFAQVGKDKIKIDSDMEIVHVAEDCKTAWYTKEDKLYKKQMKKDKVKIASDVYHVEQVYDSGEIYYVKADKEDEDDYYSRAEYELCYYTGRKEISIAKNITGNVSVAADKAVAVYQVYEDSDGSREIEDTCVAVGKKISKIKLNDVYSYGVSEDGKFVWALDDVSDSEGDLYKVKISAKKAQKPTKLSEDVYYSYINFVDGKVAYFTDVNLKDSDDEEYEEDSYYDEDDYYVEDDYDYDEDDDYYYDEDDYDYDEDDYDYDYDYYSSSSPTKGTLNVDKKKVDDDVKLTWLYYNEQAKATFYYTDYDSENSCGTLNQLKGKKGKEIADDVYSYTVAPSGKILYLADYEDGEGSLYMHKAFKPKKIDDEVSMILPVTVWE